MIEQFESYYSNYDEEGRLFRDKAHLPEWLTTIRYFDRLFAPGSQILDACAGTGRYSFYLANKGHIVTACDLVEHNVKFIRSKLDADKLNYFAMVTAEMKPGLENLDNLLSTIENEQDYMFTPTTPARIEQCAKNAGLEILHNIGVDGISFVLAEKVNTSSVEAFEKWMEYIIKYCEEPSIVGHSMHGLLIGRKS